jgi:hypothetical protein
MIPQRSRRHSNLLLLNLDYHRIHSQNPPGQLPQALEKRLPKEQLRTILIAMIQLGLPCQVSKIILRGNERARVFQTCRI